MTLYTEILFEEISGVGGNLGVITLNRPAVLNSLNQTMVLSLLKQLKAWENNNQIKGVVIRAAEGRAFCAGGDLRLTYDRIRAHNSSMPDFFRDEYHLNKTIFHYPKPYIALLDGITMGGGVGISIHGSHRVATEKLLFAMPETGIGFFPDVGGSYFLPRLDANIGIYLGLSGARLVCDDAVELGIAQHKVDREELPQLMDVLAKNPFGDEAKLMVSAILQEFNLSTQSALLKNKEAISVCFSKDTMEEIMDALTKSSNKNCQEAYAALLKKSPTSLKISLKAMRNGQHLDFDACMQQEYRLVSRFLQGHDFAEGIRAVIIDKDQTPHWQPDSIEKVTDTQVEQYFAPLEQELA
jgi:enoyl-CoA hydratase/carnithine racemase